MLAKQAAEEEKEVKRKTTVKKKGSPKKKSKLEEKFGDALKFKMPTFNPPTLDSDE